MHEDFRHQAVNVIENINQVGGMFSKHFITRHSYICDTAFSLIQNIFSTVSVDNGFKAWSNDNDQDRTCVS